MAETIRRELQQWTVRSKWTEARAETARASISFVRQDDLAVQTDGSAFCVHFVISSHALPFMISTTTSYPVISSSCSALSVFVDHLNKFANRELTTSAAGPAPGTSSPCVSLTEILTEASQCFSQLVSEASIARYEQQVAREQEEKRALQPPSAATDTTTTSAAGAAVDDDDLEPLPLQRQTTQEYLEKINTHTRGPHTKMSSLRLLHDLKLLRRADGSQHGFSASYVQDNLFHWNVQLFDFEKTSALQQELEAYAKKFGVTSPHVLLEMKFPTDYPFSPPFIRIVRPRFQPFTGNITMGGTLCLEMLSPQGWDAASDIVSLLIAIRQMLIDNGARVDLRSSSGEYAEDEATAAMFRTARILHDRSLPRAVGSFNGKYECYSPTVHDRPDMENTGKMLLPPSALEELAQDPHIDLPWLFCLMAENGARAYCGVQEFVAPEGKAFVPGWILKNLQVDEGTTLTIRSVSLPRGTYVKFQPHSAEFLDVRNHKLALEYALGNFSALMLGDTIRIVFEERVHYLNILDVKPDKVVSVIAEPYLDIQGLEEYEARQAQLASEAKAAETARRLSVADSSDTPLQEGVEYTTCDHCRKPVPKDSYERHRVFCERNNFRCEQCDRVVNIKDREEHMQLHEAVTCECGATPERQHLEQHQDRECPMRMVGCDYCGMRVRSNAKAAHETDCGAKTDVCDDCSALVLRKDKLLHIATNCMEGKFQPSIQRDEDQVPGDAEDDDRRPSAGIFGFGRGRGRVPPPPLRRQLSSYMCPNCQASIEGFDAFTAHFASCSEQQQQQ